MIKLFGCLDEYRKAPSEEKKVEQVIHHACLTVGYPNGNWGYPDAMGEILKPVHGTATRRPTMDELLEWLRLNPFVLNIEGRVVLKKQKYQHRQWFDWRDLEDVRVLYRRACILAQLVGEEEPLFLRDSRCDQNVLALINKGVDDYDPMYIGR